MWPNKRWAWRQKKKSIIRLKGKTNPAAPANTKGVCFYPFSPFSIFAWKGALKNISLQENDPRFWYNTNSLCCWPARRQKPARITLKLKWHLCRSKDPKSRRPRGFFLKRKLRSISLGKSEGQLCMLSKQNQTPNHSLRYAISRNVVC